MVQSTVTSLLDHNQITSFRKATIAHKTYRQLGCPSNFPCSFPIPNWVGEVFDHRTQLIFCISWACFKCLQSQPNLAFIFEMSAAWMVSTIIDISLYFV